MRLLAVNEKTALFERAGKSGQPDWRGFVADLLDIRKASDLMDLLLVHADIVASFERLTQSRTHQDEPWFAEGQMRDVADRARVPYCPELSNAQERFDANMAVELAAKIEANQDVFDAIRSTKRRDVIEVDLRALHDLRERWECLLTYAAIANGEEPPEDFLTASDADATVFRIHHEAIEKATKNGCWGVWETLNQRGKGKAGVNLGGVQATKHGPMCIFMLHEPGTPEALLAIACGTIAQDAINGWMPRNPNISYKPGLGFQVNTTDENVFTCLRDLIVGNRIRLCRVCGKPFIIKREGKIYCSGACKQRPYDEKKKGR